MNSSAAHGAGSERNGLKLENINSVKDNEEMPGFTVFVLIIIDLPT